MPVTFPKDRFLLEHWRDVLATPCDGSKQPGLRVIYPTADPEKVKICGHWLSRRLCRKLSILYGPA